MTIHLVGMSHRTAPMHVLDAAALPSDVAARATLRLHDLGREAVVLATCNRLEAYVVAVDSSDPDTVGRDIAEVMAGHGSLNERDFIGNSFVHRDEEAVSHLLGVAAGLDSMVVGEPQVLGQVRAAVMEGRASGTVGPELSMLFDTALRVGKQVRSETGLERAGSSMASEALGMLSYSGVRVHGSRVLLVGAGSMASLAGRALIEAGADDVVVVSRTFDSAEALALSLGGRAEPIEALERLLRVVDLVVTCAGTRGELVSEEMVRAAVAERVVREHALGFLDLAVPHDVDRGVGDIPGVVLRGLEDLAGRSASAADEQAARRIVADGVLQYAQWRRSTGATSTVVALRSLGDQVVDAELARLRSRLPDLSEAVVVELEATVRRAVAKLLHHPTVRVKQAAGSGDAENFEMAVRHLFALAESDDPSVTDGSSSPDQADLSREGVR